MNLPAVGRQANESGDRMLAKFLTRIRAELGMDFKIIVVGENDEKITGKWPGREKAEDTVRRLRDEAKLPDIFWALPGEHKDSRAFFNEYIDPHDKSVRLHGVFDPSEQDEAGRVFFSILRFDPFPVEPAKPAAVPSDLFDDLFATLKPAVQGELYEPTPEEVAEAKEIIDWTMEQEAAKAKSKPATPEPMASEDGGSKKPKKRNALALILKRSKTEKRCHHPKKLHFYNSKKQYVVGQPKPCDKHCGKCPPCLDYYLRQRLLFARMLLRTADLTLPLFVQRGKIDAKKIRKERHNLREKGLPAEQVIIRLAGDETLLIGTANTEGSHETGFEEILVLLKEIEPLITYRGKGTQQISFTAGWRLPTYVSKPNPDLMPLRPSRLLNFEIKATFEYFGCNAEMWSGCSGIVFIPKGWDWTQIQQLLDALQADECIVPGIRASSKRGSQQGTTGAGSTVLERLTPAWDDYVETLEYLEDDGRDTS
jgi:hypothetical protein